jgi:hypothetical protein
MLADGGERAKVMENKNFGRSGFPLLPHRNRATIKQTKKEKTFWSNICSSWIIITYIYVSSLILTFSHPAKATVVLVS